jgi:putative transcriptional regulator
MKPSVEKKIIGRLEEFAEALERREPIPEEFTCRRVALTSNPRPYSPKMVKAIRQRLGASQAVFALFLGVSPKTVAAWEQGVNAPSKLACRFMDLIGHDPSRYREVLRSMVVAK